MLGFSFMFGLEGSGGSRRFFHFKIAPDSWAKRSKRIVSPIVVPDYHNGR